MRRTAIALPLALVLLAGCGGSGADSTSAPASAPLTGEAGRADADDGGAGSGSGSEAEAPAGGGVGDTAGSVGGGGGGGTATSLARVAVDGTSLIRTAELDVEVDDLRRAADEAVRLVQDAGGVLAAEQTSEHGSRLQLRVPPGRFDGLLGQLAGLGEEQGRVVGTEDVTDQVVDLESRLATQRASVARVRALLDRAESIGEVVQVEAELTRRTADLESLESRLSALADRVSLGTVVLHLHTDGRGAPAGSEPIGFLTGLEAGWEAFLASFRVLAASVGALLPFLPLLLLAILGWRLRTRRPRPAGPAPADPAPAA